MMKPNRTQIEAAKQVVAQYGRDYRSTGSDLHQNTAVMAIYAILTGQLDRVPAEYSRCTSDVQLTPAVEVDDQIETLENLNSELGERIASLEEKIEELQGVIDELNSEDDSEDDSEDEYDSEDLANRTVDDLRSYAAEREIDLTGLTKKGDIIAAIQAALAPAS